MTPTHAKRRYGVCELNRFTGDIETLLIPIARQSPETLGLTGYRETQGFNSNRCLEHANHFSTVPERARYVATNQHHGVARDRWESTDA